MDGARYLKQVISHSISYSGDLRTGVNRNFQVFDPLDFLAEVTPHIPNKGERTIRYYPVPTLSRGTGLTWRLVQQQVTRHEGEACSPGRGGDGKEQ